ncbi:MAG: histidinol-phosphate transaminase [Clostridiaceae bacterium]|jgi:histidinol-phosphate aminotransferase|nr:histidinol-phosphate transaminase [Clostridiaceae bacterium]
MSRYLIKKYKALEPYIPGEQPQDMRYVKLNTNESPFPPSPAVVKALSAAEVKKLRLYSDPEARALTRAIADYYGISEAQVLCGNGSDEILAFIYTAFSDKENGMIYPEISYGFYPVFSALIGEPPCSVPLKEDYTVDVDEYLGRGKHVVIANPNAPTGICLSLTDIERLAEKNAGRLVIVDEAYIDFGGESAIPLLKKYENLIVVQTFSKSRSLAGARLGFCAASEEIIADLKKIKYSFNPYNVNRLTALAGKAAIEDTEYFGKCVAEIIRVREFTVEELKKLGFTVLPSKANFIFAGHADKDGKRLYEELKARGVLVRYFDKERLRGFVRITIGSKKDMKTLIQTVKEGMDNPR